MTKKANSLRFARQAGKLDRVAPAEEHQRRWGTAGAALLLTVAWHALVYGTLRLPGTAPRRSQELPAPTQLLAPSARVAAQVAADRKRRPTVVPPKPPPPAGPVVSLPKPSVPVVPKEARYAAEHDQRADHERRSRQATLRAVAPAPVPSAANASAPPPADPSPAAAGPPLQPPGAPARADTAQSPWPKKLAMAKSGSHGLQLALRAPQGAANKPGPQTTAPGGNRSPSGPRRALTMQDLLPDAATLARIDGAPMADIVDDSLDVGESTALNARAFRFASYFNRLKERVAGHWRPLEAIAGRDEDGSVLTWRERLTVLEVTLDAHGRIVSCQVARSAGIAALDRAAQQAFEAGQPYSNPPRALCPQGGTMTFSFAFALTAEQEGSFFGRPP